jgi:hypothetical protein
MNRKLLTLPLLFGLALGAQTPAPAPKTSEPQPTPQDVAIIKATPYKPSIQRDPFSTPRDERPAEGMDLLEDISVKGMIKKDGKNFAIVSDGRGNVRWLPVGHRFKDGEIAAISEKSVTFHQWEMNTTNRSVFRTVTKTFKREEGKR